MNQSENCLRLQEELCVFLKRMSINFPGNDALLQKNTQRLLSVMHEEERDRIRRFLNLYNYRLNNLNPEFTQIIRYDRRLMKAKDFIDRNFYMELTLPAIADYVGLSKGTLCRLFKLQLLVTFSNYVNDIRINKSIPMLLQTDDNINEIAYRCGFNSNHYFNRIFRRRKGMSPGMFRRRKKS